MPTFVFTGRETETANESYRMNAEQGPTLVEGLIGGTAFPRFHKNALLFPEVQVSRQYAVHVLKLPGRDKPTWHRWLHQALEEAERNDVEKLTVIIGDAQYCLSLKPGGS